MNSKGINIYLICLILLILECAHSLFTLTLLEGLQSIISVVMFLAFFFIYKDRRPIKQAGVIIYLLVVLSGIISYRGDARWIVISIVSRLPLLTFFMMKPEDLRILSNRLNIIFSYLIGISLGIYLLVKIGLPLPNLGRITYNQYDIINYFYLYTDSIRYDGGFTGFSLETGYFSLLCVCLICLNQFDFKRKSTIVYALAVLFSMSLEGYLLLAVGYIISAICKGNRISNVLKYATYAFLIIGAFTYTAMNYNGGNNAVGEKIIERLAFDEELGIAGNNRENYIAKPILDGIFYSDKVWFGVGAEEFNKATNVEGIDLCSWRVFVCIYGAIYTIILAISSFIWFRRTSIKYTLPFFIIFWLDFYPHGGPFTEVMYFMIIIFLLYPKADSLAYSTDVQYV